MKQMVKRGDFSRYLVQVDVKICDFLRTATRKRIRDKAFYQMDLRIVDEFLLYSAI